MHQRLAFSAANAAQNRKLRDVHGRARKRSVIDPAKNAREFLDRGTCAGKRSVSSMMCIHHYDNITVHIEESCLFAASPSPLLGALHSEVLMTHRRIVTLMALMLSIAACLPSVFADQALSPNWVGELKIGEAKHLVQLRLEVDRLPPAGTITFPASGGSHIPLSVVSVDRDHLKFAWHDDAGEESFDGRVSAGLLDGTVRAGNQQGTLH